MGEAKPVVSASVLFGRRTARSALNERSTSAPGPFETCRPTLRMSANRGRPEVASAQGRPLPCGRLRLVTNDSDWQPATRQSPRQGEPMIASLRQRPSKVRDTKIYRGSATVLGSRLGAGLAVL